MNRQTSSVDGFIPRRRYSADVSRTPAVQTHDGLTGLRASNESSNLTHAVDDREAKGIALHPEQTPVSLSRSELEASLNTIGDTVEDSTRKKRRTSRKQPLSKKLLIKRIALGVLIILVIIGGYIGIKALLAGMSMFKGDIFGLVQSHPLKKDANGRSNIVIFGTSEDDEGGLHPGAYLTDSIMVISLSQDKKDAYMFSIPRDLWVKYGRACLAGDESRINGLYACYSENGKNEAAGSDALRAKVSEVTGLDVQYYVHVNYSVVREAVDAVGGVEINIESPDPRGVLDRNFDWKCQYNCYYVKYANGPTGIMDGEHALALARARGDNNGQQTYGLGRSNFDREINQQKIMKALAAKASSAGTLTNIGKVSSLIDAFGNNLRTNFETNEIRTLMSLGNDIQIDKIQSISLVDATPAILTTDNVRGASIVRSVDGLYSFTSIQKYLKKQINSDPVVREAAAIGVFNGTDTSGLAQDTADDLESKNFTISYVGNATQGEYAAYEVYDITGKKPATKAKLAKLYGVTVKTTDPPFAVQNMDFVVIIGKAPEPKAPTQ